MTVKELRELLARATKGPWTVSDDEPGDVVLYGPAEDWLANIGNWARQHPEIDAHAASRQACEFHDDADAKLMAAMRNSADAMLDVVEAAKRWHQAPNQIAARDALMDMAAALAKLEGAGE